MYPHVKYMFTEHLPWPRRYAADAVRTVSERDRSGILGELIPCCLGQITDKKDGFRKVPQKEQRGERGLREQFQFVYHRHPG